MMESRPRLATAVSSLCLIAVVTVQMQAGSSAAQTRNETVTFARDIAPILYENCIACHRPGGSAPFSLVTFAETKGRADRLAAVTRSRYMPPWKADAWKCARRMRCASRT